jgi:Na+-transporting methylmalonyl-CoA/oxaloacetate decarboxylase gamma subunit
MLDGLFIGVVGMTTVFVVLIIIMFLMIGIQRLFSGKEQPEEAAMTEVEMGVAASSEATGAVSVQGEEHAVGLDEVLQTIGVEVQHRPQDAAELAAIALALASYMRERGRAMGDCLTIGGMDYSVHVAPLWDSPVEVLVDGEKCWASLDGRGLPVAWVPAPLRATRIAHGQRGRLWRSAYPMAQGGQWDRRGWSKKL